MCKSLETLKGNIAKGSRRLSKVTVKNIVNAGYFENIELGYSYDGYEVHKGSIVAEPVEWFNKWYNMNMIDVSFCGVDENNICKIQLRFHSNEWYYLYIDLNKDYSKKESTQQTITTTENTTSLEITYNEEKNGIELSFSEKPSEEVRSQLKQNGFRWSKFQKIWFAKDTEARRNFVNSLQPEQINYTQEVENMLKEDEITFENNTVEEVATTTENQEYKYIDANDFNNIKSLKNKYIVNWNELPLELQNFILSCDKWDVISGSLLLYKGRKAVSEGGIFIHVYEGTFTLQTMGSKDLFQWEQYKGFTENNLIEVEEATTQENISISIDGESRREKTAHTTIKDAEKEIHCRISEAHKMTADLGGYNKTFVNLKIDNIEWNFRLDLNSKFDIITFDLQEYFINTLKSDLKAYTEIEASWLSEEKRQQKINIINELLNKLQGNTTPEPPKPTKKQTNDNKDTKENNKTNNNNIVVVDFQKSTVTPQAKDNWKNEAITNKQKYALYCITKVKTNNLQITKGKASDLIAKARKGIDITAELKTLLSTKQAKAN